MPTDPPNALGRLIRESGRPQREIAVEAGLPLKTVSLVATGRTPDPRLSTVRKILEVLGLPWAALDR